MLGKKWSSKISLGKIFLHLPDHIYWLDVNNKILGCNQCQAENLGFKSPEEVAGKHISELLPAKEVKAIIANNSKVIRTKKPLIIEEGSEFYGGVKSVFLSHKVPILDDNNKVAGVIGISQNITAKKQLEQKLRNNARHLKLSKQKIARLEKSHHRFLNELAKKFSLKKNGNHESLENQILKIKDYLENIIGMMPGYVYWKDSHGRYIGCNNNYATLLKLPSRQTITGKKDKICCAIPLAKKIVQHDKQVIAENKQHDFEQTFVDENKKQLIYLTQKIPLANEDGQIIGLISAAFDVTDLKTKEKQLKEAEKSLETFNNLKQDFLLNIEHDIRTPIAGITGLTKLLLAKTKHQKKKRYLDNILKSAMTLNSYFNNLLEFNRAIHGNLPIMERRVHLNKIIDNVLRLETPAAENKKLQLIVDYPKKMPEVFLSDDFRLEKILLNLVSNAIKFTNDGQVKISFALVKKTKKKLAIVQIKVSDTGIGISPEHQQIIFEKFCRLMPANKNAYPGSGLGLSIVKKFVEDLSGEIDVLSEQNNGSTFTVWLPMRLPLVKP